MINIPKRKKGRQSKASLRDYQNDLEAVCEALTAIDDGLDIKVSSRGWCYILESHGLTKGEFDSAQRLINDCRKSGLLPVDFTAADESRRVEGLQGYIDSTNPEAEAEAIVESLWYRVRDYNPIDFWDEKLFYVEMVVEKIDLKSIFEPVCRHYHVPITNAKGWADINSRAGMMERFARHEAAGRECVLLMCNDHDPGGLSISNSMLVI